MDTNLPADLESFVQQVVASGSFGNSDEVIAEALQFLREREEGGAGETTAETSHEVWAEQLQ